MEKIYVFIQGHLHSTIFILIQENKTGGNRMWRFTFYYIYINTQIFQVHMKA